MALVTDERSRAMTPALVLKRDGARQAFERDSLAIEEPLEIRTRDGEGRESVPFVVAMRTPGHDEDLCMGLLFTEGMISSPAEVLDMRRPEDPRVAAELSRNVMIVTLAGRDRPRAVPLRSTIMGSACGVCGRVSIDDLLKTRSDEDGVDDGVDEGRRGPFVSASIVRSLPESLMRHQTVFAATGGLHAVGLFAEDGSVILVREDVGRHNAADKVIGASLREQRHAPALMLVSGRVAFEIVQKAVRARIRIVAAVSAPTSLAVDLAERAGITLLGFLRGDRFNTYTHPHRVVDDD
jgi:FdhD protein